MNKLIFLFLITLLTNFVLAQSIQIDNKVEVIKCTEFRITKPLRDMVPMTEKQILDMQNEVKESADRKYRIPYMKSSNPDALPKGEDPAIQKNMGNKMMKAPLVSWNGQNGALPPDPTGSAGYNHFVQAVNSAYRIYNKTGGSVPGGGPFNLGNLLFGSNDGDPIVMYDKFADRWFISEFGISGNKIYIAVSQTGDPTGAYYTYQYTSSEFPDYLKFSIWSDGYYMTSNTSQQKVYVFERDQMLVGNASARSVSKVFSPPKSGFFCPLTGFADGQLPPAGTPCPIFSYEDDSWGSADRINIYEMSVNWAATPTATILLKTRLNTEPFDASYDPSWDDIEQPNSSQKLDGIGGVFTFRAQYRVWTGYNTVVLNNGVKVNTTTGQRSIRWYELRQNSSTGDWSIYQQSTYCPDLLNRWCGSIAMDDNGSIGLAYAISGIDGANVYPSIRYTGRASTDPLNQMTYTEQIAATGNFSQGGGSNRFGDYSHTSLDPVDGTIFWHTGEYFYNSTRMTKIFSFHIPSSAGIDENETSISFNAYYKNSQININASGLPNTDKIVVDLFDVTGKKISGDIVSVSSNKFETILNIGKLSAGIYLLRIGINNTSFQKVKKIMIN